MLGRPPTIRAAGRLIVALTTITVLAAGGAIRIFDAGEYPSLGLGLWWALQTVTTVGYGDVVPHELSGRLIAAFVMLEGIAFITIVTAAVTSTFIERARRERPTLEGLTPADVHDAIASVGERLDRIEKRLSELSG